MFTVMMRKAQFWVSGVCTSMICESSTTPPMASLPRRLPMDSATWRMVTPRVTVRCDPSGKVMMMLEESPAAADGCICEVFKDMVVVIA